MSDNDRNIADAAEYLKAHAQQIELHRHDIALQRWKELNAVEKHFIKLKGAAELTRVLNKTFRITLYAKTFPQDAVNGHTPEPTQEQECQGQENLQQKEEETRRSFYKQMIRLKREQKLQSEPFECRRCPATFPSNTKLHHHIQAHHTKKPAVQTPPPLGTPEKLKTTATPSKLSFSPITCIEIQPSPPFTLIRSEQSTPSSQEFPERRNLERGILRWSGEMSAKIV